MGFGVAGSGGEGGGYRLRKPQRCYGYGVRVWGYERVGGGEV